MPYQERQGDLEGQEAQEGQEGQEDLKAPEGRNLQQA
jgi:hypothetical protein